MRGALVRTFARARVRAIALVLAASPACHATDAKHDSADASTNAPRDVFDGSSASALTESAARLFDEAAPEATAAVVGPLALQLAPRGTDKHDLRVSLDRVWVLCKATPASCESATRDFVSKTVRTLRMSGLPATRDQVVAVLRSRAYVDAVGGPSAPNAVIEPFVDDLYVVYMVDLGDSMRSLAVGELAAIVPDRRALPAVATANLAPHVGRLADALASLEPGSFSVLRSDNVFESSRLLMGDEWAALASKVGKPIVVAAPSGEVVLVAIGPTQDQLVTMRGTAREMFSTAHRPVSPRLFRWATSTWAVVP